MALNFDDTEKEPTVLPARIPNLLVNGETGISAGYATEIPTHILSEVLDALFYLIKHPTASLDKLMEFIPGPDFPTGGIIQGIDGIRKAYQTGRGRVVVRAKTEIETLRGGRQQINVTEIPYEVNKAQLVKRINDLRLAKKVEGIAEARDETDRSGLRIAIELKRGANANGILNYLLKNTDLQINYNFNMVAIDDQRPMRVGLKRILTSYLEFQKEIIRRRTQYNLTKAQQRLHIVEGLIKALSILDKVIKTIRASKNRKDAKENLVKEYNFTPEQAEAIVTLQLYRLTNTDVTELEKEQLTNTDVTELEKEQEQLNSRINEYQLILTNENELAKVLTKEIRAIKKEFGNPRRTKIENHVEKLEIDTKVTVANEDVVVLVSHAGYIKRSSIRSFKASEAEENGLREDDYPLLIQQTNTLSHLFMFTNLGHIIYRPIHEIADARWKDTGEHISQTIGLADNEEIIKAMIFDKLDQPGTIIMGTSDGQVKQTAFNDYKPGSRYKSHASVAIKLRDNAQVVNVDYYEPTNENRSLLTISRQGYAVRYDVADVPVTGIRTAGVRAINLKDDDQVADQILNRSLLTISRQGYAVRYDVADVPVTGIRTAGVRAINLKDDDQVADQILVKDGQDIAVITQRGAFKEMPVDEIEVGARARRGELVLRRLKSHPHEIADFLAYDHDYQGAFETITNRPAFQDIMATDHHLSSIKSNGTFVIDTDTQGEPVKLRMKQTNVLSEEPVGQN